MPRTFRHGINSARTQVQPPAHIPGNQQPGRSDRPPPRGASPAVGATRTASACSSQSAASCGGDGDGRQVTSKTAATRPYRSCRGPRPGPGRADRGHGHHRALHRHHRGPLRTRPKTRLPPLHRLLGTHYPATLTNTSRRPRPGPQTGPRPSRVIPVTEAGGVGYHAPAAAPRPRRHRHPHPHRTPHRPPPVRPNQTANHAAPAAAPLHHRAAPVSQHRLAVSLAALRTDLKALKTDHRATPPTQPRRAAPHRTAQRLHLAFAPDRRQTVLDS